MREWQEFFIVQGLEVDAILGLEVVGNLGDDTDHGNWFLLTLLFLDLLHLLSISEDFEWIGLSTFHDPVPELFTESEDEHLSLDEHFLGVQSKLDGIFDSGLLCV